MQEFCLQEQCYSPTACNGFGFCRELNGCTHARHAEVVGQRCAKALSEAGADFISEIDGEDIIANMVLTAVLDALDADRYKRLLEESRIKK